MELALSEKEQSTQVYDLYLKGNCLLAKNKLDLSKRFYLRVLKLIKKGLPVNTAIYADTLHNLGMIAEQEQKHEAAIEYYQLAVTVNPQRSMTWIFLAKLYFERFQNLKHDEDYQLGINALNQADTGTVHFPAVKYLKNKFNIA